MTNIVRNTAASLLSITALNVTSANGDQSFEVVATADNVYELYLGDPDGLNGTNGLNTIVVNPLSVFDFGGALNTTAGQIFVPETYSLIAPDISYIYIAAWSDDAVQQGFLADFHNLTLGGHVFSGDSLWEVTATGIDKDTLSPKPTESQITAQIQLANAGTNPSGGWQSVTASPLDDGSGGIHNVSVTGIDDSANWMWYDSGNDGAATAPFNGFNHEEYLIFRTPVAVPEPSSLALLACGIAILGMRRPRSAKA